MNRKTAILFLSESEKYSDSAYVVKCLGKIIVKMVSQYSTNFLFMKL